jgi:hypothetical protein
VAGNARNVTIHTPDQCYTGAGYEMEGEKQSYKHDIELENGKTMSVEFVTATFRKEDPHQITRLRIFWTFSDDGNWHGPKVEKVSLAGKKYMAKVYLITQIPLQPEDPFSNPALKLADGFFPALNKALFSGLDDDSNSAAAPAVAEPASSPELSESSS